MKQSLERKINAYRQAKHTKQSFDGFIEQKKKNLKYLLEQDTFEQSQNDLLKLEKQNKYSSTSEFSKKLELKQQEYFRQMQEIQNLKLQVIQKNNDLQNLKMEISFQRKAYESLVDNVKYEREQAQNLIDQIVKKQTDEITEIRKVYRQRYTANLDHISQLQKEKQQQNEVRMNFVNKKKKFEKDKEQMKKNHQVALRQNKKLWGQQQLQNREKWEKQKKQEIAQNTLKGIEPQIQRIIGSSKAEIKKIEEKYEIMRQEYRLQRIKQYERRAMEMRQDSFETLEKEKRKILGEYSEKLTQQFEALEEQFEKDRKKIRAQREDQIRQLEEKRKNQTEEFICTNKDFYKTHLQEVKSIKEQYEAQIRELDGRYELEIQKEEDTIRLKYNQKLQRETQNKRKHLENQIKNFTIDYEKQTQTLYEDLVEKVAVSNDLYESQVRAMTEDKIKDMRDKFQSDIKKLRKTITALEAKICSLSKEAAAKKVSRQQMEQAMEEAKRQNEYLQRKLTEYQNDLIQKKSSIKSNTNLDEHPQVRSLKRQWEEQITKAKQACVALQKQIEQSEEIMAQKIASLRTQYSENINMLEKNSLKLLNIKKNELAKLKNDKEMQQKYGEGLDQMIKKQKALLQKFQQQQKTILNNTKRPSIQK